MRDDVDLDAYFERIGYSGDPGANLATLRDLHLRHPLAIPFENLSTLLREQIPLDLRSLQKKLITAGRGGYCFEQDRLFAGVLAALGFDVAGLAARVVWNRRTAEPGARSHMVLCVRLGGQTLIADVGFGGLTLTGPLSLEPDVEQQTPHEVFRLRRDQLDYELQVKLQSQWRPMYRFDLQEQLPIDFEVLNHFVATHPQSHFLTTLIAARPTAQGRYALANNELTEYHGTDKTQRSLRSGAEIGRVLTEIFGVQLPRSAALAPLLDSIAAQ